VSSDRFVHMKRIRIFTVAVLLTALLAMPASACFDPSDPYAVEVDLGSAGIAVDIAAVSLMVQTAQNVYVDIPGFSGIVFSAHGDGRLWCLLTENGVRLQVPLEEGEHMPQPLVETADVDWQAALAAELEWLEDNGLLDGDVFLLDINAISALAMTGTAGHNEMLRWFNGTWVQGITPEMEVDGLFMIRHNGSGCGGPGVYNLGGAATTTTTTTTAVTTTSAGMSAGVVMAMLATATACVYLLWNSRIR